MTLFQIFETSLLKFGSWLNKLSILKNHLINKRRAPNKRRVYEAEF